MYGARQHPFLRYEQVVYTKIKLREQKTEAGIANELG